MKERLFPRLPAKRVNLLNMKLVIGLGNPGADYRRTRHNLGFMVMDELARGWGVKFKGHSRSNSQKAEFCFKGQAVILAKPQTFMNLSGDTAGKLIRLYGIKIQDILVVCDDIRLELGSIRIREKGSAGGHNGLASIIEALGSDGFARLRTGASCADVRGDLSRYVLADFPKGQAPPAGGDLQGNRSRRILDRRGNRKDNEQV